MGWFTGPVVAEKAPETETILNPVVSFMKYVFVSVKLGAIFAFELNAFALMTDVAVTGIGVVYIVEVAVGVVPFVVYRIVILGSGLVITIF